MKKLFLSFSNDAEPAYISNNPENNNEANNIHPCSYTTLYSDVPNSTDS